jgi:hypothetical protein
MFQIHCKQNVLSCHPPFSYVLLLEKLHIQSNKLFDSAKYDHHVLQYIDAILYKYKPGLNGGSYSEEPHIHEYFISG